MTDTSRKTVENKVCRPIEAVARCEITISKKDAAEMVGIILTLVKERDAMSSGLAFLASRAGDLSKDAIEYIAKQALENK